MTRFVRALRLPGRWNGSETGSNYDVRAFIHPGTRIVNNTVSLLLVACVVVTAISGFVLGFRWPVWHAPATTDRLLSSILLNLSYGVSTSLLQVGVGLVLAMAIVRVENRLMDIHLGYKSSGRTRAAALTDKFMRIASLGLPALLMVVYCLQPLAVEDIFVHRLGLPSTSPLSLVLASIWQYAPFCAVFFVATIRASSPEERWMLEVESAPGIRNFIHLHWPDVRAIAVKLLALRFMWMMTKFELPNMFLDNAPVKTLPVLINRSTTAEDVGYYTSILLLLIAIVLKVTTTVAGSLDRRRDARTRKSRRYSAPAGRFDAWVGRSPSLTAVLSALLVAAYLVPLVLEFEHLGTRMFGAIRNSSEVISSLLNTIAMALSVGILSAVTALYLAHGAEMGQRFVRTVTNQSRYIYGFPMVFMGFVAFGLYDVLKEFNNAELRIPENWGMLSAPQTITLLVAYFVFCVPFAYTLIDSFARKALTPERTALINQDAAAGGLVLGTLKNNRHVWPFLFVVAYFVFIITWQDAAIPARICHSGGQDMFSRYLTITVYKNPDAHDRLIATGASMGVSLILGALYCFLHRTLLKMFKEARN